MTREGGVGIQRVPWQLNPSHFLDPHLRRKARRKGKRERGGEGRKRGRKKKEKEKGGQEGKRRRLVFQLPSVWKHFKLTSMVQALPL